jgi:hypothetical protein
MIGKSRKDVKVKKSETDHRIINMSTDASDSATVGSDVYRIRVKGRLDPSWSEWLGGFTIQFQCDDNTLLIGAVADQSALQGILNKLFGMNLKLLSLKLTKK